MNVYEIKYFINLIIYFILFNFYLIIKYQNLNIKNFKKFYLNIQKLYS